MSYPPKTEVTYVLEVTVQRVTVTQLSATSAVTAKPERQVSELARHVIHESHLTTLLGKGARLLTLVGEFTSGSPELTVESPVKPT